MMMPAVDFRENDSTEFQAHFVQCGGLKLLLNILVDKNFLAQADVSLKRYDDGLCQFIQYFKCGLEATSKHLLSH